MTQRRMMGLDIVILRYCDQEMDGQHLADIERHIQGYSLDGEATEREPKPAVARLSDLYDAGLLEGGAGPTMYVTSERGRRVVANWDKTPAARHTQSVSEAQATPAAETTTLQRPAAPRANTKRASR